MSTDILPINTYDLWPKLVQKHTKGGACNFQNAATELADMLLSEQNVAAITVISDLLRQIENSDGTAQIDTKNAECVLQQLIGKRSIWFV